MSLFPSIDDLKKNDDKKQQSAPAVSVASSKTQEQFTKKMQQIKHKELETKALRVAENFGGKYPYINLEKFPLSQEALRQVSREIAEELKAICFFITPDEVRVGAINPDDEKVQGLLYELEERNRARGGLYLISEASFDHVFDLYKTLPVIKPISKDIEIKGDDLERVQTGIFDFKTVQDALVRKSVSDTLTIILGAALKLESSDVHVEIEDQNILVRFRIDGILHEAAKLDAKVLKRLISRIKLVSSLKINITDKPQDGRFTIKLAEYDVDVRVSIIPTVHGESIVMRLLNQSQEGLEIDKLGLRGHALEVIKREIMRPNGMILTSGPTGSGKTTTLYAILKILNKPGIKIITLEDPVEYRLEGVNQSQIDSSKKYGFAQGLRSLLRQDPDIVMVGEIRDTETAEIAVQAALTGHLMLSTVHTNNASGAIPRLLSMGVKPFLLTPALNTMMGQRLVRRLCDSCRKKINFNEMSEEIKKEVEDILSKLPDKEKKEIADKERIFYQPGKCEKCSNLGYKGRIGIYEIFIVTPEIEQLISSGRISEYEIEETAIKQGMITMAQDGLLKALDGLTSVEEIFRVIE